jgi:N-acetylneuraminic acid mutarotase
VDSDTAVLFGGLSPTGTQNDVWEYKMADKKWTRLHEGGAGPMDTAAYSTVPSPRTGHVGVVLRGDLYVFGGYDPSRGDTNDVWKFTRAAGTWHRLEPAGGADVPASRSGHAAVAPDPGGSKFTVFGGNMRNDVWEFDVDTGAWTVVMTEYAGSSGAAMRGVGAVLVAVGAAAATTLASGEWWRNF